MRHSRYKIFIILFFSLPFSTFAQAQKDHEVITKAKAYVTDHKYESAFKTLQDYDPSNSKPDIVLYKEDIALNYFLTSIMHQMFSFKDIPKDENIRGYRGQNGTSTMYLFAADKILDSLLNLYPDNYKLYKGLGDYYYQVYLKYGEHWLIKQDELFSKIENDYKIAIDHKLGDFQSYYALGYVMVSRGSYKQGIPYLEKSLQFDNNSADAHYNVAYAYLYTEDPQNALKHAKAAIKLYQDTAERADAARMTAAIYAAMKNYKKAADYGELSNSIEPHNYYTLKNLLDYYLKDKYEYRIKATTEELYNLGPEKPTIYNDLSDIYMDNERVPDLIQFFREKIPKAADNKVQLGSIYFYLGRLLIDVDKKEAKDDILKARDILSQVYPKDHQVFKVIEDTLKLLN
jgi:tetratricopeptide (TPR) repeat protein